MSTQVHKNNNTFSRVEESAAMRAFQELDGDDQLPTTDPALELSVVMPCLNEAETLGICIEKAQRALRDGKITGEIVVADNGSTDGSQAIAIRMGARVIPVQAKGYGSALIGGIAAARGKFIIMGDSDDSYDFLEIPRFVEKLRQGFDLVQGCRLPSGDRKPVQDFEN